MKPGRTEDVLHEAHWTTMSRATIDAEMAIRDARDFVQAVLRYEEEARSPKGSQRGQTIRDLGGRWLERYGG